MAVGWRFKTRARTLTEADVVGFCRYAGFVESLFQDHVYRASETPYVKNPVPAAFTLAAAEGLIMQTGVVDETGIALLSVDKISIAKPVFVGDTIHAVVEVTESRPTKTGTRGIVTTRNLVLNQNGDVVLEYIPVRLMKGQD